MMYFEKPIGGKRYYSQYPDEEKLQRIEAISIEAINKGKSWLQESAELDFEPAQRQELSPNCRNIFD